jgi:predicted dehydrogenase
MYSKRLNLGKIQWPANVIEDLAPHDISIFNYISGRRCKEVQATGYSYVTKDIEEVAFLNFRYEDNITAHMHLSWLDPMKVRDIVVVGSKQMVTCDSGTKRIEIYDKGVDISVRKNISNIDYAQHLLNYKYGDITIPYIDSYEPLYSECNDFVSSIKLKGQPRANGHVGLDVVKILCAAQASLKNDNIWIEP